MCENHLLIRIFAIAYGMKSLSLCAVAPKGGRGPLGMRALSKKGTSMESCKQREGRITVTRHTRLESFMRAVLAVLISLALLPTAPLQALADEQTPSTTTENVVNDGSEPAGTESSDEGSVDSDASESGWQIGKDDPSAVAATLSDDGTLTVSGAGDTQAFASADEVPWHDAVASIKTVVFEDGVAPTNLDWWFSGAATEGYITMTIPEGVTSMVGTFKDCGIYMMNPPAIPEGVKDLSYCFSGCTNLSMAPKLPASAETLAYTFENCTNRLTSMPDVPANAVDLTGFVKGCVKIAQAPYMELPSSVKSVSEMFMGTGLRGTGAAAKWLPASVEDVSSLFENCTALSSISNMLVLPETVKDASNMCKGCTSLSSIAEGFDVPDGVTDASGMFEGCDALATLPASLTIPEGASTDSMFAHEGETLTTTVSAEPDPSLAGLPWAEWNRELTWEGKQPAGSSHEVGDTFTFEYEPIGTMTAKVTSTNPAEVCIVETAEEDRSHDGEDITFPSTATDEEGCEYTVTELGDGQSTGPGGQGYSKLLQICETLTIPASVKKVNDYAFYNMYPTGLVFEEGSQLESIGAYGFARIAAAITQGGGEHYDIYESIVFPESLKTIGDGAFDRLANVKKLDFSHCKNLESIGKYAFEGQYQPRMMEYFTNLEEIDFSGCTSLKSIGYEAFSYHRIKKIDLSPLTALEQVDTRAFGNELEMTEIVIAPNLDPDKVAADAFGRNPKLTTIDFSHCNFKELKGFDDCETLTTIIYPEGVESVQFKAGYTIDPTAAQEGDHRNFVLTNLELPATVKSLSIAGCPNFEFDDIHHAAVENLESLSISDEDIVTLDLSKYVGIKSLSFDGCSKLETITAMPQELKDWSGLFSGCASLKSLPEIPEGVESLSHAFEGCTGITEAPRIPDSVTNMDYAFAGCENLEVTPNVPDSVTSMAYTFSQCSKLTETPTLPSKVENLDGAFFKCAGITETPEIPATVRNMSSTFSNSGITEFPVIPEGVTDISNVVNSCTGITEIPASSIPGTVTNAMQFAYRTGITVAPQLPDSVTVMAGAFGYCENLTTASEFPQNVESINNVYKGCESLVSMPSKIPDTVTKMMSAFAECPKLTRIPDGFTMPTEFSNMRDGIWVFQLLSGGTLRTFVGENPSDSVKNYNWAGDNREIIEKDGPAIVETWNIGPSDNESAVIATLDEYGALVISGTGATKTFESVEEAPWYQDVDDEGTRSIDVITSVSFAKGVEPANLDHWFEGADTLSSYDDLPGSVASMVGTFKDCALLVKCGALPEGVTDLTSCFQGCSRLSAIPELPAKVTTLSSALQGTDVRSIPAIPEGAVNLSGMFRGCPNLQSAIAQFPESVKDVSFLFEGCAGLRSLGVGFAFPKNASDVTGMFKDCSSLDSLPEDFSFPESTKDYSSMFEGCNALVELPEVLIIPEGAVTTNLFTATGDYSSANLLETRAPYNIDASVTGLDWGSYNRKLVLDEPDAVYKQSDGYEPYTGWQAARYSESQDSGATGGGGAVNGRTGWPAWSLTNPLSIGVSSYGNGTGSEVTVVNDANDTNTSGENGPDNTWRYKNVILPGYNVEDNGTINFSFDYMGAGGLTASNVFNGEGGIIIAKSDNAADWSDSANVAVELTASNMSVSNTNDNWRKTVSLSVPTENLEPDTTYYLVIKSGTREGNACTWADYVFEFSTDPGRSASWEGDLSTAAYLGNQGDGAKLGMLDPGRGEVVTNLSSIGAAFDNKVTLPMVLNAGKITFTATCDGGGSNQQTTSQFESAAQGKIAVYVSDPMASGSFSTAGLQTAGAISYEQAGPVDMPTFYGVDMVVSGLEAGETYWLVVDGSFQPGVNQPLGKPIVFEFTTEAGAGADKTALDSAIDEATAALEATMVSADGTDVPSNKKWVSQDAYDAYKSAIETAQGVLDDGAADQDAVDAAVADLAEAAKAFQAAQKDGTATPAIATYDIGLANASDVKATLLEDGTLVFTGHGDIQQWTTGRSYAPWYTDGNYLKIKKVRFEMDEGDYAVNFTKCFYMCENLEEIEGEFPEQMAGMQQMFDGCVKLTEVPAIPDGVTNMYMAFNACSALAKAPELPDGLTDMRSTFAGCENLTETPTIPDGVTNMSLAFNDTAITSAPSIPDGVTDLSFTFSGTDIVEMPEIPAGVETMQACFRDCAKLVEVKDIAADLSGGTTSLNQAISGLFQGCSSLKSTPKIVSTSGATNMRANNLYSGCTSLEEATSLPSGITALDSAFMNCTSLKKVCEIPEGVTSMGNTFQGCSALTGVSNIPSAVTNLQATFANCTSLSEVPELPAGLTSLWGTFNNTGIVKAPAIPYGVTNMQSAFIDCANLVEAPLIPETVTNMNSAFEGCNKLVQLPEGFSFPEGASTSNAFKADGSYSVLNPLETKADGKVDASVLAYDWTASNRSLVLASEGAQATLLADVKAAEEALNAAVVTDNLANLPQNFLAVSSEARQAYADAIAQAKETLSDAASDDAAYAAASAALAQAKEALSASGKAGQLNVNGVKAYNLGAPAQAGGEPTDAVRAILCDDGNLLFAGAGATVADKVPWSGELTAIRSYEFQDGVKPTSIRNWFNGCSNLENAGAIPEGVTDMRNAFQNCASLVQAPETPSTVVQMDNAYNGSAIVAAPVIPEGVTSLTNAFRNCAALAEVPLIPSTVTAMRYAFQDCTALTSLPDGFSIPEGANADGAFKLSAPYSSTNLLTTYCDPADYETLAAAYDWAASNRKLVAKEAAATSWNIGAVNETDVTATYDADTATLAIAGTGAMKDFASAADAPWFADFGTSIEYVTIADGVTNIGSYALGLENLKTVKGGNALATVADNAFTGAANLVAADLSGCTLTSVAANSFGTVDDAVATQRTVYVKDAATAKAIKDACASGVAAQTAVAVMNGGSFAADTAFEAGKLAEPAQEGFTFVTWTSDEYLQHPVSAWAPLSQYVLYAKFNEVQQPVEPQEYADVAQYGQGLDQTVRLLDVSKLPQSVVPTGTIQFFGETDEHYDNRFISAFNGNNDIEFAYIMSRGTNANTGDGSYQLSFTLPYISIVNEAGDTVASYDNGIGALKHLATYFNGNDTDKSGTITAVKIGVDAGLLPAGTYTLRFGKDFGANNGKSFLGKNVDFQFEVAYPEQYELTYSFDAQTGTATVTGVRALEGASGFDVVVPEKATDPSTGVECTVAAVADNAFAGAEGVASVTLPATAESIGGGAFANMPNVEYVKVLSQGDAAKPTWGAGVFDGSADLTLYGYPTSSAQQAAGSYENVTFASLEDGIYVNGVAVADGGTVTLSADSPQATVSIMKDGDVVTDQYRGYITNTNVASHPGTAPSEWSTLTAQANGEADLVIKGADGTAFATLKIAAQGFDSDASTEGTVLAAPQGLGSNVQMVNAGEILTYAFDETKAYFDNRLTDPVGVENALFAINVAGPGSAWGIDRWDWNEFKQIADENLWLEDAQGNKVATFGDGLAWVQLSGELATQNTIMLSVDSGVMKPGETYVLVAGENFAGHNTAAKLLKAVRWTFTAAATDLADCTVSEVADQEWTGSAIEPKPEVSIETPATRIWDPAAGKNAVTPAGTRMLTEDVDYTLSYADNTESGTATVTVTGEGGFTGTVERTFTIGDEPAGNKLLLADIADAQGFLDGLTVADDAANLADGTQWATPADAEKLQAAIDEAQAVAGKADATQEEFDAARDALAEELAAFKASAVKTAVVNGTALSEALDEASDAMVAVQVSKDGTDVLTTASWVTPDDMAAFAAAIAKAQDALADPARTQASIDQALADLSAAADAFDAAKKPGTKVAGGGAGEGQTPGTGTGNGTGNGGSEDGKQSTTGSNVKGLSPTGDAAPILPLTAIALISIGCTVVAMRRIMHR